jgi:hypothetical protein
MTFPGLSSDTARELLGAPDGGTLLVYAGYMTEWNPTTRENVVAGGAQTFVNLHMINPTALAVGPVLLIDTPAAPIILGRIYNAEPAP